MHKRTIYEPNGSTTDWESENGVSWTMVSKSSKADQWCTWDHVRYNITSTELLELRKACVVMKLDWKAQAARPVIARKLIAMYKVGLPEIISPGIF